MRVTEEDYNKGTKEQHRQYDEVFKEEIVDFGEIYDSDIDVNTWCPECAEYDIFMNSINSIDIVITCFPCFIKEVVA
jgi:hypothetical protein